MNISHKTVFVTCRLDVRSQNGYQTSIYFRAALKTQTASVFFGKQRAQWRTFRYDRGGRFCATGRANAGATQETVELPNIVADKREDRFKPC